MAARCRRVSGGRDTANHTRLTLSRHDEVLEPAPIGRVDEAGAAAELGQGRLSCILSLGIV